LKKITKDYLGKKMSEEIRDVMLEFFRLHNCELEFAESSSLIKIKNLPKIIEELIGRRAPVCFAFDAHTANKYKCELLDAQSSVTNTIIEFILSGSTANYIEAIKKENLLQEILKQQIKFHNCDYKLSIGESIDRKRVFEKPSVVYRVRFKREIHWLNNKIEDYEEFFVNEQNLVKIDLESFGLKDKLHERQAIDHNSISLTYKKAKEQMEKEAEEKIDPIISENNTLFLKEKNAIIAHFNNQVNDEKDPDEFRREMEHNLEEQRKRFSITVDIMLTNMTIMEFVLIPVSITIMRHDVSKAIKTSYHPVKDKFRLPKCESCKNETNEINLCTNSHISCNDCINKCSSCQQDFCNACLEKKCAKCQSKLCKKCTLYCPECKKEYCKNHMTKCSLCGQEKCINCLILCDACGKPVCKTHLKKCPSCGKRVCEKCSKKYFKKCIVCKKVVCDNCLQTCSVCDEVLCKEHAHKCHSCKKSACPDHIIECAICKKESHRGCLEKCEGCGKKVCEAHLLTCPKCKSSVCENCEIVTPHLLGLFRTRRCKVCSKG
jgi:hypothetical protein